jgi:hypothetical protein
VFHVSGIFLLFGISQGASDATGQQKSCDKRTELLCR